MSGVEEVVAATLDGMDLSAENSCCGCASGNEDGFLLAPELIAALAAAGIQLVRVNPFEEATVVEDVDAARGLRLSQVERELRDTKKRMADIEKWLDVNYETWRWLAHRDDESDE